MDIISSLSIIIIFAILLYVVATATGKHSSSKTSSTTFQSDESNNETEKKSSNNIKDYIEQNKAMIDQCINEEIGTGYDSSDIIECFDINISILKKHQRLIDHELTNGHIYVFDILKQCNINDLKGDCKYLFIDISNYSDGKSIYCSVRDKRLLLDDYEWTKYIYTTDYTEKLLLLEIDLKQAIKHLTNYSEKKELQDMLNKIENGTFTQQDKAIELDSENQKYYEKRADYYFEQCCYDKAIADYNKLIELNPNHATYYEQRAGVYVEQTEYDKAIADYSKAIELDSENQKYYEKRADLYFEQCCYDKAIADYNKAIELDTEAADYYWRRANVYAELKEYDKAIDDYSKAIELDTEPAFYYGRRANVYAEMKEYDKAINDYSKAIELDTEPAFYYGQRADVYVEIKEYDKALDDYNKAISDYGKAIELNPEYEWHYLDRADVYVKMKEYDKALADYNKLIEENPKDYDILCKRASVWIELGKIEEAKIDLRKAKKYVNDTEKEAQIQRTLDSLKSTKSKQKTTSSKSTTTNKKQVTVTVQNHDEKENNIKAEKYIENANSYENRKDYINAINEYTKAIELNPDNIAEIYVYRAQCCMEFGQYSNVIEDCTNAIKKTKMYNSTAYYTRGLAYQKLNEKEKAKEDFKQALSIKPDDVTYKKAYDSLLKESSSKINIENCTIADILSLDGFNAEKAERFINDRDNGKMWYDIDTFVQEFELQPHEMVLIQDRIKFPDKPKNKYGRKIDI